MAAVVQTDGVQQFTCQWVPQSASAGTRLFRVRAGDATSLPRDLLVLLNPSVTDVDLSLAAPAYTGRPPTPVLDKTIEVLAGSVLTIDARTNTPVAAGGLAFADGQSRGLSVSADDPAPLDGSDRTPDARRVSDIRPRRVWQRQPAAGELRHPHRGRPAADDRADRPGRRCAAACGSIACHRSPGRRRLRRGGGCPTLAQRFGRLLPVGGHLPAGSDPCGHRGAACWRRRLAPRVSRRRSGWRRDARPPAGQTAGTQAFTVTIYQPGQPLGLAAAGPPGRDGPPGRTNLPSGAESASPPATAPALAAVPDDLGPTELRQEIAQSRPAGRAAAGQAGRAPGPAGAGRWRRRAGPPAPRCRAGSPGYCVPRTGRRRIRRRSRSTHRLQQRRATRRRRAKRVAPRAVRPMRRLRRRWRRHPFRRPKRWPKRVRRLALRRRGRSRRRPRRPRWARRIHKPSPRADHRRARRPTPRPAASRAHRRPIRRSRWPAPRRRAAQAGQQVAGWCVASRWQSARRRLRRRWHRRPPSRPQHQGNEVQRLALRWRHRMRPWPRRPSRVQRIPRPSRPTPRSLRRAPRRRAPPGQQALAGAPPVVGNPPGTQVPPATAGASAQPANVRTAAAASPGRTAGAPASAQPKLVAQPAVAGATSRPSAQATGARLPRRSRGPANRRREPRGRSPIRWPAHHPPARPTIPARPTAPSRRARPRRTRVIREGQATPPGPETPPHARQSAPPEDQIPQPDKDDGPGPNGASTNAPPAGDEGQIPSSSAGGGSRPGQGSGGSSGSPAPGQPGSPMGAAPNGGQNQSSGAAPAPPPANRRADPPRRLGRRPRWWDRPRARVSGWPDLARWSTYWRGAQSVRRQSVAGCRRTVWPLSPGLLARRRSRAWHAAGRACRGRSG